MPHPARHLLVDQHLQYSLHLRAQLPFRAVAVPQVAEEGGQAGEGAHDVARAAAMATEMRLHSAVSSFSLRLPLALRR